MSRRPSAFSALIAIDKPAGMTSFDVVARVRRAVGEKRVGHAGTLDPAATGVLVVGIGQATKLLGQLTLDRKGYAATFQLGSETTTDDAEGEVTRTAEVPAELFDVASAKRLVAELEGEHDQVPPAYSAVSVGGRRAYAMARAGERVELASRRVRIYASHLLEVRSEERSWVVSLDVSKGTYVRSIARDLGRDLGCFAHVSALRRTFSGPVTLDDCVTLEELEAGGAELVRERCLDPAFVLGLPVRELDVSEVVDVSCGRRIAAGLVRDGVVDREPDQGEHVALTFGGALAGIWERRGAELACVSNFPQAIEGVRPPLDLGALGPEAPLGARGARRLLASSLPHGYAYRGGRVFEALGGAAVGSLALPYHELPFGGAVADEAGEPARDDYSVEMAALGEDRRFVFAIGAFDGLHRGHRALLARARREADRRGCRLAAVSFDPDPAHVLCGPGRSAADLLSVEEREELLIDSGVDALLTFSFTPELARVSYQDFVRGALGAFMDVAAIVVGEDFRLGADGAGCVAALADLGRAAGFDVVGMRLADADGAPISSTRIRRLLGEGSVEEAAELLGRLHVVRGRVAHGRGEGTSFGFPTANVEVEEGRCLPAEGVYAGYVVVGDRTSGTTAWPAAINVGKPRSFSPGEEGSPFLEATLLGFDGDLYGELVSVAFVRWLRVPQVFDSVDELERTVLGNVDWVRRSLGERGVLLEEGRA